MPIKHLTKKVAPLTTLIGLSVVFASSASAVLVTEWDYNIDSAWTDFTDVLPGAPFETAGSNDNAFFGDPTTLSWGEPFNDPADPQSSLSIVGTTGGGAFGNSTGSVTTNAGAVDTGSVQHDNQIIRVDPITGILDTAVLSTALTLDPTSPDLGIIGPTTLEFDIAFNETLNAAAPCPAGDANPCNDIFMIDVTGAGFANLGGGNFGLLFDVLIGATNHEVIVGIEGLTDLSTVNGGALCAAPCFGFITEENQLNSFDTTLEIRAAVPEPGMLSLLGLGLLGVAFKTRKRTA